MSTELRNDPALMTVSEAARIYRLSPATIRSHVRAGKLAGCRVGGEFRIYSYQPDALLDPRRGPAPDKNRIR